MSEERRVCSGGPHGEAWCGAWATVVCTAPDGLQWFACELHTEGSVTEPLGPWLARVLSSFGLKDEE